MAHYPVNHPLRPLYRALGALSGLYLVLFGITGIIVNAGDDFFAVHTDGVLGQGANLFWSILATLIGVLVLLVTALGRNLDNEGYKFLGWALLVFGSYGLATSRTDANFLGFTIATVIATFIVGLLLITSSLYVKVAPPSESHQVRDGRAREAQSA